MRAGAGKGAGSVTVKKPAWQQDATTFKMQAALSGDYISGRGEQSRKATFKVTGVVGSDGKAWLGQRSNR